MTKRAKISICGLGDDWLWAGQVRWYGMAWIGWDGCGEVGDVGGEITVVLKSRSKTRYSTRW